jgi:Fur family peroxide stress response transcriptional regulator
MDLSGPAIERRLATFRQRCGDLGLSLTPQRLAIYRALASTAVHPSAEDLFREVKPALPSLSLGTVYRTLELFESHGLISRVAIGGDQARFDANLDAHHHLVCLRCHAVIDFQDARLQQLPLPEVAPAGFRVLAHRVHLLGLCRSCGETD